MSRFAHLKTLHDTPSSIDCEKQTKAWNGRKKIAPIHFKNPCDADQSGIGFFPMSLESRRLRAQALPEDVSRPAQKMLERIRAIRRLMPTLGPQSRLAAEQEADRLLAEWEGHLRMHADFTDALRRHFGGRIQAAVDDVRQSALT